jgi:hypothetical protein
LPHSRGLEPFRKRRAKASAEVVVQCIVPYSPPMKKRAKREAFSGAGQLLIMVSKRFKSVTAHQIYACLLPSKQACGVDAS